MCMLHVWSQKRCPPCSGVRRYKILWFCHEIFLYCDQSVVFESSSLRSSSSTLCLNRLVFCKWQDWVKVINSDAKVRSDSQASGWNEQKLRIWAWPSWHAIFSQNNDFHSDPTNVGQIFVGDGCSKGVICHRAADGETLIDTAINSSA
jgi:hypothetical protein